MSLPNTFAIVKFAVADDEASRVVDLRDHCTNVLGENCGDRTWLSPFAAHRLTIVFPALHICLKDQVMVILGQDAEVRIIEELGSIHSIGAAAPSDMLPRLLTNDYGPFDTVTLLEQLAPALFDLRALFIMSKIREDAAGALGNADFEVRFLLDVQAPMSAVGLSLMVSQFINNFFHTYNTSPHLLHIGYSMQPAATVGVMCFGSNFRYAFAAAAAKANENVQFFGSAYGPIATWPPLNLPLRRAEIVEACHHRTEKLLYRDSD